MSNVFVMDGKNGIRKSIRIDDDNTLEELQ